MHGWHGRILFVDLSTQSFHIEPLSEELCFASLGGRGLALHLFREHTHLEPLDPHIPLILTTGPLSGTGTPATERLCILSRSPLTGTVFDTSGGGSFARGLKSSGYDGLCITGAGQHPCSLRITPAGADFQPADTLWGQSTSATLAANANHNAAVIGPAGEQGVRYANIVFSDGDNDGRGGLGAVMGSKKLKAITVAGNRQTTVADPQRLRTAQQDIMRLFRAAPALLGPLGLHEFGTPTLLDLTNQRRMLPTRNFRATHFAAAGNLSGPAVRRALAPAHDRCFDCPIACKKTSSRYGRLPDYTALGHLGPLLDINDLSAIVAAHRTCRELGIDPVSAAATLATYAEITGVALQAASLPDQLSGICRGHEASSLLAQGAQRLAAELGQPQAAMTVKSLEIPAFDPRGAYGIALSYCTSTLGGSHARANLEAPEILRKPVAVDRFSFSGKARLLKNAEDAHAASDSLIVCANALYGASLEEYADALGAVTGQDFSPADLYRAGARIVTTERSINRRNGFSAGDDQLPERFFLAPGTDGDGLLIPPLSRSALSEELHRYERIRDGVSMHAVNPSTPGQPG